MSNDPLLRFEEIDIESIQMFWEDKDRIGALCSLINVMELFYKKGFLGHYYLLAKLKDAIKSSISILRRHIGLKTDAIAEVLITIDSVVSDIVEDEKEGFKAPHEVTANAISTRVRDILRRYPSEVVFALGYSVTTPRITRSREVFLKRLRFEE